ncbi:MAG: T9SS type A sorting domain-containing protein [Ferruginibacter sp.]
MNRTFTLFIISFFFVSKISAQTKKVIVQEAYEALRNGNWVATTKGTYAYDNNCFMIHSLQENWDTTQNTWKNTYQSDITNDAVGNMTQTVAQSWDTISNSWIYYYKQLMSYTATNKYLRGDNYVYANGSWADDYKIYYQYNSSDLLDNFWGEYYDSTMTAWFHTNKARFIYDANGHRVESWGDSWDETVPDWVPYQHTLTHFNSQGKADTSINYVNWTGAWEPQARSLYDYSVAGVITRTDQFWNTTALVWDNRSQYDSYLDADGDKYQTINKSWNTATGQFEIYGRVTLTYENCGSVIPPAPSRPGLYSIIYPNPVGSELKFTLSGTGTAKYIITDISGRKLASGAFEGNDISIPVGNFAGGVYSIRFERGGVKITDRFVKR